MSPKDCPMRYYPVNLDIRGRNCLVAGGGAVGTRKVQTLLECGASVKVVSPEANRRLQQLAEQGKIVLARKRYASRDLEGMFLVIGATNDQELNRRIYQDAQRCGCLCNIADQPRLCNFILPSVVQRGDLTISISTSGRSPAFAKHLRLELEKRFGEEYGVFLELMGAVREKILATGHAPEAHRELFGRLIQSDLLELIKTGDHQQIDKLLQKVLGPGFSYQQLLSRTTQAE